MKMNQIMSRLHLPVSLAVANLLLIGISQGQSKDLGKSVVIQSKTYKAAPSSAESKAGEKLLSQNNCMICHSIAAKGGCLAPPFDGIGARRSKSFIYNRICDTSSAKKQFAQQYTHAELMPHPRLAAKQAGQITAYLLTLPYPPGGFRVFEHSTEKQTASTPAPSGQKLISSSQAAIAAGRKVFYEHGCIACHTIGKIGGHLAPSLDGISKRRDYSYIVKRITNAEFFTQEHPDEYQGRGNIMPPSNLTAGEISSIANFLMSLPAH